MMTDAEFKTKVDVLYSKFSQFVTARYQMVQLGLQAVSNIEYRILLQTPQGQIIYVVWKDKAGEVHWGTL